MRIAPFLTFPRKRGKGSLSFLAPASSLQPPASRAICLLRAIARATFGVAAALALTGCGNIEPWVKPYERQALADPIMALDPYPVSTSYMHHVFEAREGARGALGSGGGGCGCN